MYEAGVVFPAGHDEPLVGRVALIDDGVAEVALFGFEGDAVGVGEGGGEGGQDNQRAQADGAVAGQFGFEYARGQVGDGGVEDAEQKGRNAPCRVWGARRSGKSRETASAPK